MRPTTLEAVVRLDRVLDSGIEADDWRIWVDTVRHSVRIAVHHGFLEADHDAARAVDQTQCWLVHQQHNLSAD